MSAFEWLGLAFILFYFLSVMPAQMPGDFKLVALLFFTVVYVITLPLSRWKRRRTIEFFKGERPPPRRLLIEIVFFLMLFGCMFLSSSFK